MIYDTLDPGQDLGPDDLPDKAFEDIRLAKIRLLRHSIIAGTYQVPAAQLADKIICALLDDSKRYLTASIEASSGAAHD